MEIYTCRSKDNIYNIARRFNIDAPELIRLNRLNSTCSLPEGLSLLIPGKSRPNRSSAQFFFCSSRKLSESQSQELTPFLSAIVFCNSRILPDGSLAPASFTQASPFHSQGVLPLLSVNNLSEDLNFDSSAVHNLLQTECCRNSFCDQVLEALENGGFGGLCLQFNYINSFDRDSFSQLLEELSVLLHRQGKYLIVCAAPKLSDMSSEPGSSALDYAALGQFCDRVALQTYDWGHSSSAPQSTAPLHKVRQSIGYALNHIPSWKLLLGISDHGYRWQLPWRQGRTADAVCHHIAQSLAISNGATIRFDKLSQTPFFSFNSSGNQRCIVCYEDVRSLLLKLQLISEYSLAGAALFSSAPPDSRLLYMLQELFDLEKLI